MGFFVVSIVVRFKEYFLREFLNGPELSSGEKKHLKSGINTGKEHHKRLRRVTNMDDRQKYNLVAKSQSQPKKTLHPKIDVCIKTQKNIGLGELEANDIMAQYQICPTQEEPLKAIKQTGVSLHMVRPNENPLVKTVYCLVYTHKGGKHGTSTVFKQGL